MATFWVLFVFSATGWILGTLNNEQVSLSARNDEHFSMLIDALLNPLANIMNIYFGLIMGVSAMIPTCVHLYMSGRAIVWVASK